MAAAIGAATQIVRVSKEDIQKIRYKHRISFYALGLASIALRYGWAARDPAKPHVLVFAYEDREIFGKLFKAVVKATGDGYGLYLETFHRIRLADLKRLQERCSLVEREHY